MYSFPFPNIIDEVNILTLAKCPIWYVNVLYHCHKLLDISIFYAWRLNEFF